MSELRNVSRASGKAGGEALGGGGAVPVGTGNVALLAAAVGEGEEESVAGAPPVTETGRGKVCRAI